MTEETPKSQRSQLWDAITRLATDAGFRRDATTSPELVPRTFELSLQELDGLWEGARLSGVDVQAIGELREAELQQKMAARRMTDGINCCCCCCSEEK